VQIPSSSSIKAPDTVREFASGESNLLPLGFNFPHIEAARLMIERVFDLDGRFTRRNPFVIRNVDSVDEKSLALNAVTDISPD
jgi:hypothetical protein